MAQDFRQDPTNEDAAAVAAAKAAADEEARVKAEEKAKADAAAAEEASNQDAEPEVVYAQVVLDSEWAEALDVDSATVGTANGEYVLTSTPVDVPQSDLENVLASPAAQEVK